MNSDHSLNSPFNQQLHMASQRFLALDVFRGMTVCFMIIVNTPGTWSAVYAPLLHANWHGFTPTDLVFPSFLFAVGNALSFVMTRWSILPQQTVLWKIIKRTLLIFLIGYLLSWLPFFRIDNNNNISAWPISETRILGVLQRIALCYGTAALMIYYLKPKWVLGISFLILLGYKWLLFGWGDLTLQGNAALKLDLFLMGPDHLYKGEGIPFDPEGWLSTLPAIVNVIAGYYAGNYIQLKGKTYEGLAGLLLAGCALTAIGYFWDFSFPINKKLWTSSFVLYTVGLDCIILAAVLYIIEFRKKTNWTYFFEVFGKNPLFIYIVADVLVVILTLIYINPKSTLFQWVYVNIFKHLGAHLGSFLFAITFMLICWLVGWWMDKRKIYIRV